MPTLERVDNMEMRLVKLHVQGVAGLPDYYGFKAKLIDQIVDAVELANRRSIGYVDDRDGEAGEYAVAVAHARASGQPAAIKHYERALLAYAKPRLLHGEVVAVRMIL